VQAVTRRLSRVFVVAALLTVATTAVAAPNKAAREAYARGLAAHAHGDLALAAREFARADELAPNAVALQAALDAAVEANDSTLGNELLERSKREPPSPALATSIAAAHAKFRDRASSQAEPPPAPPTNEPAPPAADPSPRSTSHERGISPLGFWIGIGATAVVGSITTYFALDASNQHTAFDDAGCARADFPSCRGLKRDGESSQEAANIGLALTAIAGVATAVVGVAFTNWSSPIVAVRPGGGEAGWRVSF
jgi:hypothetical protein